MFLVILSYIRPLDEVDAHLDAHRAFLDEQYRRGVFVLSGPRQPRSGGVILARAESAEALERVLASDPFHVHGLARYELHAFAVRAAAPGLEHLIEPPR